MQAVSHFFSSCYDILQYGVDGDGEIDGDNDEVKIKSTRNQYIYICFT